MTTLRMILANPGRVTDRESPEETLPGDDNAPDPGHPGDGEDDNAHQGPDQPGEGMTAPSRALTKSRRGMGVWPTPGGDF